MHDFRDYLRAYWKHVRTRGLIKAAGFVLVWVAGMFVPAGARSFVQLPDWLAYAWMIGWAIGGYVVAPYGMWKHQRAEVARSGSPDRS
jgi:hypothetical protein